MSLRPIRRALLSVSDKTGLVDLARVLSEFGVELISTGGTRKALQDAGLAVPDIAEVTGFPEILDGRVKTLHPRVHGGILAVRDNPEHLATLEAQGIEPIDLIVCNHFLFRDAEKGDLAAVAHVGEHIAECSRAAGHLQAHVEAFLHPQFLLHFGDGLLADIEGYAHS